MTSPGHAHLDRQLIIMTLYHARDVAFDDAMNFWGIAVVYGVYRPGEWL